MNEAGLLRFLEELGARHGERGRGKILQRLLELAFHSAGFRLVDERISEGTDFDVCRREPPHERYSLEARTTVSHTVPVKPEDLRLLDERGRDGYRTGFAVLRIGSPSRWVFFGREWLLPPFARVSLGTSPGWHGLCQAIGGAFNEVAGRLGARALDEGLEGLEEELRKAKR